MIHVGLDMHKKFSEVAVIESDGNSQMEIYWTGAGCGLDRVAEHYSALNESSISLAIEA